MKMSTFDPYFNDILKNTANHLFFHHYNFFYLALAISKSPASDLEKIGIALNRDKFKKYRSYVRKSNSSNLETALSKSLSCLRAFLSENTDKSDKKSSEAMSSITRIADEIYLEALTTLRRPHP